MRVCQFRHFGFEVRQTNTGAGDGKLLLYFQRAEQSCQTEDIADNAVITGDRRNRT
jgi:hypothetical protein